MFKTKPIF